MWKCFFVFFSFPFFPSIGFIHTIALHSYLTWVCGYMCYAHEKKHKVCVLNNTSTQGITAQKYYNYKHNFDKKKTFGISQHRSLLDDDFVRFILQKVNTLFLCTVHLKMMWGKKTLNRIRNGAFARKCVCECKRSFF